MRRSIRSALKCIVPIYLFIIFNYLFYDIVPKSLGFTFSRPRSLHWLLVVITVIHDSIRVKVTALNAVTGQFFEIKEQNYTNYFHNILEHERAAKIDQHFTLLTQSWSRKLSVLQPQNQIKDEKNYRPLTRADRRKAIKIIRKNKPSKFLGRRLPLRLRRSGRCSPNAGCLDSMQLRTLNSASFWGGLRGSGNQASGQVLAT